MAPQPIQSPFLGYLTPHGAQAEILLGSYFRSYLLAEGLLTGSDAEDAQKSYFRANSIQRSNVTPPRWRLVSCRRLPCRCMPLDK